MGKAQPTDYTGREREKALAANEAAIKARSQELGMITQYKEEASQEVIDMTVRPELPTIVDDITIIGEGEDDSVLIRINSDLENMTYGVGNHYTFAQGGRYRVSRDLAQHLEEKGYVWH